jgi:hypothetical protein
MKKIYNTVKTILLNSTYGNGVSNLDKLNTALFRTKYKLNQYSPTEVANLESVIGQINVAKEYIALIAEKNLLIDDIKSCKSKNPDNKCRNCNCWKHTRDICS